MHNNSTHSWHVLSTYTGMMCQLSYYKHHMYTIVLVLKPGWW